MSKKETTFTLNGKEYTLKFSMRVPLYWEQATKRNYFEAFGPGSKPSLTDILTLVWAAFKNGGCTLSLEELAALELELEVLDSELESDAEDSDLE